MDKFIQNMRRVKPSDSEIGTRMTRMRRISADRIQMRSAVIRFIRVIRVPIGRQDSGKILSTSHLRVVRYSSKSAAS